MTTAVSGAQYRLTGRLTVALPPAQAFRLFTARGEEDWAPGWKPHFPVDSVDDSVPGTVFETRAHHHPTTWVVVERRQPALIRYARLTPQATAGIVTVTLDEVDGGSDVTVTYELTALTADAGPELAAFAGRYRAFLRSWEDAIGSALRTGSDRARSDPAGSARTRSDRTGSDR